MSYFAPSRTRKIYPLTSLRFFLAMLVVFHHSVRVFLPVFSDVAPDRVPEDFFSRLFVSLTFSVSFFFLLSGYVLSMVYLRGGQPVDRSRFFTARFARLYPLYLVMMALGTPAVLAAKVSRYGLASGLGKTAVTLAGHLVMLQGWSPNRLLAIDPPSWSLSAEILFYLCFPVSGVVLWRLRGVRLWLTALGLYVGGQALVWAARPHLSARTVLMWPPLHLSTFALGVLLARWQTLRQEERRDVARNWQVNAVLALSLGGLLLSAVLLPYFHVVEPYGNGMLAPIFASVIWAVSVPTWFSRLLCANWLVALGNASYAMYLIHIPLLLLFQQFHWVGLELYPVYLVLCVGISVLSFHYFETPVRLWVLERFHTRSLEPVEAVSSAQ